MTRAAAVVLMLAAASTCARTRGEQSSGAQASGGPAPAAPAAASDTAVGWAVEVGSDPATWMALELPAGGVQLRLAGAAAQMLRSVTGAEVWVTGGREPGGFRVDAFEVRRVNGVPVDDGVVVVTDGAVGIRLRSGAQRAVPHAPAALRDLAGARIWISRPVADVAPSYGVIAP